jgi:AraC-like DNA-binding protein
MDVKKVLSIAISKKLIILFLSFPLTFASLLGQKTSDYSYETIKDSVYKCVDQNKERTQFWVDFYFSKARKENNSLEECKAWEKAINVSLYQKDIQKALKQSEDLFSWAKNSTNKEVVGRAYLIKGQMKMYEPNLKAALDNYYVALEIAKPLKKSDLKELVLSSISSVLQFSGDYKKTLEIQREMLAFFKAKQIDSNYTKTKKNQQIIYLNAALATTFRKMNLMDSAVICEKNMTKLLKDADSCTNSLLFISQAERAYKEKRFADAKPLFIKTQTFCPSDVPLMQLNYKYQLGKVEHGLKNYLVTIEILQSGLDNYKVLPEEEAYMLDYYKLLANAYKQTSDFQKANFYFEKYIHSSAESAKIKGEANKAFREKEMKDFQIELKKLESEKKAQSNFLNLILIFGSWFIIILLILLLRFYRIRKKNEIRFEELLSKLNSSENQVNIIDSKDSVLEEIATSDVAPEITTQILDGLKDLEEKHYFLNSECNSYNVAKKIKTNTSYLSKVVNQEFEKNFNTYINDLRINHAIVQLKNDQKFRSYSIQSIAEDLGYKSADSFTKYFKLHTGLNPSFYIKQLNTL